MYKDGTCSERIEDKKKKKKKKKKENRKT